MTLDELATLIGETREGKRFLAKIDVGTAPEHAPDMGPCLTWNACTSDGGYGRFKNQDSVLVYSHVWAWETVHGRAVADGHDVDHQCHNYEMCTLGRACPHRACVNADHLQEITKHENWARSNTPSAQRARQTHCSGCGASLMPGSPHLYLTPDGRRECRRCQARRDRAYRARKHARKVNGLAQAGQLTLV